ncbi:MAG: M1 family aminopeptidase [Bacteroidota bacterium]
MKRHLPLFLISLFISLSSYTQETKNYYHEAKPFLKSQEKEKSDLLYDYDVKFYHLDIEASNESDLIEGNVLIKTKVKTDELNQFGIELVNSLTVDSVIINGKNSNFEHNDNLLEVELGTTFSSGDNLDARVYYNGETGSGMRKETDSKWGKDVNYTLSESFHAKDWFPSKEVLTDKADSAYIYVTTDENLKVGSNGILKGIDSLDNEKVRYRWETSHPINYYLISVAIGDFLEYSYYMTSGEGDSDSLLIQNFLYDEQECLNENKNVIDQTADFIALLNDKYGPYPFKDEKYGHCMAPFGGAMEHQTMSTMGYFDFGITIHELAHQWFGDYVTCADWQDIWINEGFASYTEYLGEEFLHDQESADAWMKDAHDYILSEKGGSVYVPESYKEFESRIFDYRLTYKKGAAIVHQIRFELNNDSVFFKTLRNFLSEYADSAATGEDFREVLEQTSGKDFSDFFDQWYYGEGHPIIQTEVVRPENSDSVSLVVKQESSMPQITPFFKMHTEYLIQHSEGDTLIRTYQKQPKDTFNINMPHEIESIEVDPNNWIINEVNQSPTSFENQLSDNDDKKWELYPNPVKGNLHIKHLSSKKPGYTNINLYNAKGVKVNSYRFTGNKEMIINFNELASGVYYVELISEKHQSTQKIINIE